MGGSGHHQGSLKKAIQHSLNQVTYLMEIGRWLGLTFKHEKLEAPRSYKALLGVTLDLIQRTVSLKIGKSHSVSEFTDNIISNLF